MGRFAVVAYTPKPGRERALIDVVKKHLRVLRAEGLATEKPASVMRGESGAVVEVFEWKSKEAIASAHGNARVKALWAEFEAACEYTPLAKLPEAARMFAEFESVDL